MTSDNQQQSAPSDLDEPEPERFDALDLASEHQQQLRKAMDSAVRMLGMREHSAFELKGKLKAKGHAGDVIDAVLAKLRELDLQSDDRFTEVFVRSRLAKGQGPMRIRHDLGQKGVSELLLEEALSQPAEFWLEVAEQARNRRFGEALPEGDGDVWNTQARFLSRRGFPSDLIYRILGSRF